MLSILEISYDNSLITNKLVLLIYSALYRVNAFATAMCVLTSFIKRAFNVNFSLIIVELVLEMISSASEFAISFNVL